MKCRNLLDDVKTAAWSLLRDKLRRHLFTGGAASGMLKDESRCIRCGLYAARCPAGTITVESYNLVSADPTGLISVESIDRPLRAKPAIAGTLKR